MEQSNIASDLARAALSRRGFLGGVVSGGLVSGGLTAGSLAAGELFGGRTPQSTSGCMARLGDLEDMAAAQRLVDLEFSDEQLKGIVRRIQRQRAGFKSLRSRDVDWWSAPAFEFDPLPSGATEPKREGKAMFAIPSSADSLSTKSIDLAYASITHLAVLLRAKRVTSRKLTELCIARLKKHDPELLCVVTLLEKTALAAADKADAELAAGKIRGPLHGIPYGAKDLFSWPGAPTTFGAAPYRDQVLETKSTVLQRLEDSGAILVAKLTLGALAMGDVWFGGRTKNPWNTRRGSSGSSAGPAAAVAAGLLPFSIGTETLGSIVSPCTVCGVSGLRPTFGTVSRHGAMPLSWTMDKVGPIARHADDLAIVFDAIHGVDGKDKMLRQAAFDWPVEKAKDQAKPLAGKRIGVVEVRGRSGNSTKELIEFLKEAGAEIGEMTLPKFPYGAIRTILSVEAATSFDDLTRSADIDKLTRQGPGAWPSTFRAARFVPAVEFLRANRVRSQLLGAMHEAMKGFDAVIDNRTALTCTNLTGHPSVVLPVGKSRRPGPASTTIIGQLYGESTILAIASAWQQKSQYHLGRPIGESQKPKPQSQRGAKAPIR